MSMFVFPDLFVAVGVTSGDNAPACQVAQGGEALRRRHDGRYNMMIVI